MSFGNILDIYTEKMSLFFCIIKLTPFSFMLLLNIIMNTTLSWLRYIMTLKSTKMRIMGSKSIIGAILVPIICCYIILGLIIEIIYRHNGVNRTSKCVGSNNYQQESTAR